MSCFDFKSICYCLTSCLTPVGDYSNNCAWSYKRRIVANVLFKIINPSVSERNDGDLLLDFGSFGKNQLKTPNIRVYICVYINMTYVVVVVVDCVYGGGGGRGECFMQQTWYYMVIHTSRLDVLSLKNPRKTRKWVGGSSPNSDYYFYWGNFVCFVCFLCCFHVSKKKIGFGGGWVGSGQSEFFSDYFTFLTWQDPLSDFHLYGHVGQ